MNACPGDRFTARLRWIYLAASIILIVVFPLAPIRERHADFLAISVGVLIPVTIGMLRVPPDQRLPWKILFFALVTVNAGNVLGLTSMRPAVTAGRVTDAVGNALILAAVLIVVLRRSRYDRGGVIDATIVALATGGVLWETLIRAHLVGVYRSTPARADALVVIFALAGVIGALIRLAQTTPRSAGALRVLVVALVLALGANLIFVMQPGGWPHTAAVVMLLVAYTLVGLFCLHTAPVELATSEIALRREAVSGARLVFLGIAVGVIPLAVGARALLGQPTDGLLLIAGYLPIAVLVMVRIGLLAAERARAERALEHRANRDALTGLPNRRELVNALDERIRRGEGSVLLFCDLDGFKAVNDERGHGVGDLVLIETARRLEECVRAADVVSRFGGDEFLILLDVSGPTDVDAICRRIADALSRPFDVPGGQATIGISIGVATASTDTAADDLIDQADQAMYAAKRTAPVEPTVRITTLPTD
jgi:diguanylate cyclase (GGDEF)-like protein